ncbi:hypothetical protein C1645_815238 [Glomus cerebriforme]|uniref:Uncharacterized protein n=1 Tax=Glomus cerebriforme TaxID=658196 RepID=A0A397TJC8_9GLOM|nr:hypothetical protein C1645_815238 [Glomus cerebriforme]
MPLGTCLLNTERSWLNTERSWLNTERSWVSCNLRRGFKKRYEHQTVLGTCLVNMKRPWELVLENSSQKSDMPNKPVAKNKCQYIEVNADVEQEQKLIDNKLNTQKFHEEYDIAGPSSRMSQKPVFITSSDKNEEDKKKANKKKS